MGDFVLEALHITKVFPGVKALNDVIIQVKKGEVLGLIGENGAGKSTILKVMNGIYRPLTFEGEIKINGEGVNFSSPHDALLKGIGFVPQEINVMDDLTVAENIFVGHIKQRKSDSISQAEIIKRAGAFLHKKKINLDPGVRVNVLSIGQKQLLMIARALSWEPEVLILDEPTTALALDDVNNLFEIVKEMKSKGTSVVFVTHKLDEIMELTDRVAILRDGCNVSLYERKEYDRKQIVTDMVGRTITSMYPSRDTQIGEEILRVEDLTVEHPRILNRNLIEGISFTLNKGEVLGLVGLVGSGRTETLSTIFGQYKLKRGRILINGRAVAIKNESDAIQNGLAMVTEDRKSDGLLMLADIKTNIVLSNLKKILKNKVIQNKLEKNVAEEYMKMLNVRAPTSETMAVSLSGGNQQKVVFAKALNADPKIILLDEPTKGIDVGSKNEIYTLINKLAAMGISIIMVSSELPEILAMCDRFIVMAHGMTVGELLKSEATQESVMSKCFA